MFEGIFGKKKNVTNKDAAFHITITNKKTGKVEYDADTNAIIGAVDMGDRANGICRTEADAITCAAVLASARKSIDRFADDHPELEIILQIASIKKQKESDGESKDTAE